MRKPSDVLKQKLLCWQPDKIGTLIYVLRDHPQSHDPEVLLIEKLSGHGQGLINGPGGKLEPDETLFACARRELQEEVNLGAGQLRLCGRIRFVDLHAPQWLGFVFTTTIAQGSPSATVAAIPRWYPVHDLPWEQMWPSDKLWLPNILAAKQLEVNLLFDSGNLLAEQVLSNAG